MKNINNYINEVLVKHNITHEESSLAELIINLFKSFKKEIPLNKFTDLGDVKLMSLRVENSNIDDKMFDVFKQKIKSYPDPDKEISIQKNEPISIKTNGQFVAISQGVKNRHAMIMPLDLYKEIKKSL